MGAEAVQAAPPFSYRFVDRPWPAHSWSVRDAGNRQVGTSRTRAGARAAVRALFAQGRGRRLMLVRWQPVPRRRRPRRLQLWLAQTAFALNEVRGVLLTVPAWAALVGCHTS